MPINHDPKPPISLSRCGNTKTTMRRSVVLVGLLASTVACGESSTNGDGTSGSGGALAGTGGQGAAPTGGSSGGVPATGGTAGITTGGTTSGTASGGAGRG